MPENADFGLSCSKMPQAGKYGMYRSEVDSGSAKVSCDHVGSFAGHVLL
jgi:hypothetical protein